MTPDDTSGGALQWALCWLATYGLHSTLFLGGAWLACRLGRLGERSRERLWKLGLVGGVLSATLQLALGARAPLGQLELAAPLAARGADEAGAPRRSPPPVEPARPTPERMEPGAATAHERTEVVPAMEPALVAAQPALGRAAPAHERNERASRSRPARATPERSKDLHTIASARPKDALRALPPPAPRAEPTFVPQSAFARLAERAPARWPGFVLATWIALGLAGLAGLAGSWTLLWRRMLARTPVRDVALLARFGRLCARAGLDGRVRLTVSDRIRSPFSTGLVRREVCLPRAVLSALTPVQQDALLAHEVAHLVRRDPLWFAAGLLLERLFFFQPLNRLARRRLSDLAETACDDWAVRWTGARIALASCLTEVAGWMLAEEPRLAAPALAGQRSRLAQRIERLLDDRLSPSGDPPARWWPPLAAGALALAALGAPGVSAATPERAAPPEANVPKNAAEAAAPRASEPQLAPSEARAGSTPDAADPRSVLDAELALLEGELCALRAELAARDLGPRFEKALAEMQARLDALHAQQCRVSELLARLTALPTPISSVAGEPAASAPAPTHPSQGVSR
jgi:beta-lactamase regulating signal transducer with metallopeptidase domain